MLCFGGGSIDVSEPVPLEVQEVYEPPWLASFLDSEEYLTDCPLNCFNKGQQIEGRPVRAHRRRYFCIECPEEGAQCLARIMDQHLRHRVLKVRKVTGGGGPVIKARDVDQLVNISLVHRLSNSTDEFLYVKLTSFRQSVWGTSPQKILCYECLRLASSKEDQMYKYCSIKCAYPGATPSNQVGVSRASTGPAEQLGCISGVTSVASDNLQARALLRSKSCRGPSICRHDLQFSHPGAAGPSGRQEAAASSPDVPASPATSDTSSSTASRGWRSRLSRYLSFSSSKKHIPHMENLSPSTISSQERRSSSDRFEISPWKESVGVARRDATELRSDYDQHGQASGRPPRRTLLEKRQSQANAKVNSKGSAKVASNDGPRASPVGSDHSLLVKSRANLGATLARRLNDQNVRGGAATKLCWRSQDSDPSDDDDGLQDRWGAVRGRVLSSPALPYMRIKLENEARRSSLEPSQASSTEPAAPYTMNAFVDTNSNFRCSRARLEYAVYTGHSEDNPDRGFGQAIDNHKTPNSRDYQNILL